MRQSGGVRLVGSNGPRDGSAFTPGRDLASTLAQLVKQSPVLDLDDQDPFKVALLGKVAAMVPHPGRASNRCSQLWRWHWLRRNRPLLRSTAALPRLASSWFNSRRSLTCLIPFGLEQEAAELAYAKAQADAEAELQKHNKALLVGMQLDGSDAVAPPIPFETIMASLGALTASEKAAVASRLGLPRHAHSSAQVCRKKRHWRGRSEGTYLHDRLQSAATNCYLHDPVLQATCEILPWTSRLNNSATSTNLACAGERVLEGGCETSPDSSPRSPKSALSAASRWPVFWAH